MPRSDRYEQNNRSRSRTVTRDSRNSGSAESHGGERATISFDYDRDKAIRASAHRSKAAAAGSQTAGARRSSSGSSGAGTRRQSASPSAGTRKPSSGSSAKQARKSSGSSGGRPPGKSSKKKKAAKKRRKRSGFVIFFRTLFITIIMVVVIGGVAAAGYTAYVISHAETIHPDRIYDTLDVSTHIYDDSGKLVDDIYFSENREITTYEELPDNLKNAFIAVEDKTFWTHKGFNFRRIIGAILERFHGGRISGTSTITQQLARNVFLPEEKSERSLKRKITEMYYAYEIEEELSKEEILTAYLNTIYLGYGCYGVDTAARTYFSRPVEKLTLAQCAALAALPQAPGAYGLIVNEKGEHTSKISKGVYANDASRDRRDLILRLMEEQGYITAKQRKKAAKPLKDFIKPGSTSTAASKSAFKDYLIETVKKDLMDQYDLTEEQAVKIIYTKGLNIYSTMDSQAQKVITSEFKNRDSFPSAQKEGASVEAAMVITEVGTGQIKAMAGTRNVTGQMLFNRATNPRQPGSSIKPLAVYAPALQKSLEYARNHDYFPFQDFGYDKQGDEKWGDYLTAGSTVIDEKMKINGQEWPHNVTRSYSGKNTFRTAIQKSINTCAVKILAQVGVEYSMDTLKRFGITTAVSDISEPYNDMNFAALGLGAMTEGVTPLEMSAAYAVFPGDGVWHKPYCYTRVEDSSGRTILEGSKESVKVLDPGVAWIMTDVLKSIVTDGIGRNAAVSGTEVGGKTGTTDDRYDIWFDGFTPSYSAALWIGTDDNVRMDSASDVAATLWSKIMSQVNGAFGSSYSSMPDNVIKKDGEYYTKGTEPEDEEVDEDEKIDQTHGWSDGESDMFEPEPEIELPDDFDDLFESDEEEDADQ